VRRVWGDHLSGRSYGWEIWGLMVLSAWHRSRVRSRPGPGTAGPGPVRRHIPDGGSGTRPLDRLP
jgi:hypothetical protein